MAIGGPIPAKLAAAISQRENLISSENKTPDTFKFTHARSSFAICRSLAHVGGSFEIPKSAVLSAGTGITGRAGIDREAGRDLSTSEAAYYQNDVYGFRPMPGITNINSQALGRTGATRKTVITFQANSKEDLDLLAKTYFNFGIHVVVEFGHTVYLNATGEVKELTLGDFVSNDDIFTATPSIGNIKKKIAQSIKDANYSYEGLVGKVTGYNFTVTPEGTYLCTLDLISDNHVMDSLKVPSVTGTIGKFALDPEADPEVSLQEEVSNLVGIVCDRIRRWNGGEGKIEASTLLNDSTVGLDDVANAFKEGPAPYNILFSRLIDVNTQGPVTAESANKGANNISEGSVVAFVDLRFLMRLFNRFALPKVNGNQLVRLDEGGHSFTSFSKHFSLNPGMVLLPKKSHIPELNVFAAEEYKRGSDFDGQAQTPFHGNSQNILDIKVSIDLIQKVNQSFINLTSTEEAEVGLTDFLTKLIKEVEKYLGKINNFVISREPDSDDVAIFDHARGVGAGPKLNLTGLSSTVTGFNIAAQMGNKIGVAAMMAGSGEDSNGGMSTSGPANLNKEADVKDGIGKISIDKVTVNSSDEGDSNADTTKGGEDMLSILKAKYEAWNKGEDNTFEKSIDAASDYLQSLRGSKRIGKFNILPIDLSLTMLGVGGFRNLDCFTIPQHLVPERFGNKNYMITNIEHSIDASTSLWETTVTAKLKPST